MAQDVATSSPAALPAVSTRDPASILLLPAWLMSQLGAVSDPGAGRTEVDPVTRAITKRVPTILRSKMPTGPQRQAIERRITELRDAGVPGPIEDTIAVLGELIQEYAPARLDPKTVTIKAEAYLDALEDLPAWAIREAIRRWRRGDVSADAQTLDFAPRPARMRAIAEGIANVARGQAICLQRILDAEPYDETTEEHRGEMQRQLAGEIRLQQMIAPVDAAANAAASARKREFLADLEARKTKRLAAEAADLQAKAAKPEQEDAT